jgi:tetratricopeptide (TPR) repeat protein
MKPALKWILITIVLVGFAWSATALVRGSLDVWRSHQVQQATQQLRTLYFSEQYERGVLLGADFVRRFPEAPELKAWYASCLEPNDRDRAIAIGRQMTSTRPTEPWSWFALAMALHMGNFKGEALEASRKALALNPHHPDFLYLRAWTLFTANPEHVDEAIAFVDQHRSDNANPVEILVIKARALEFLGTQIHQDAKKVNDAYEILDEARRLDSSNFHAAFIQGMLLSRSGEVDKGMPLLREAIRLRPESIQAHRELWRAYNALDPPRQQEMRREIEADVDEASASHAHEPMAMTRIAEEYGTLGMKDKQDHIEDSILKEHSGDPAARNVVWYRLLRIERDLIAGNARGEPPPARTASFDLTPAEIPSLEPAVIRERNAATQRFVLSHIDPLEKLSHPAVQDKFLLSDLYEVLFLSLEQDPGSDSALLLRAVRGMRDNSDSRPTGYEPRAILALGNRGIDLDEAEKMARTWISRQEKLFAEDDSPDWNSTETRRYRAETMADFHDALGWVLLRRGHTSEARKELELAYTLDPGEIENLYHLGQLARSQSDLKRAEDLFAECAALPSRRENPCRTALEALYHKQHGSDGGYDQFSKGILEKGSLLRKERLLASRLPDPHAIPPFQMKSLEGEVASSESLKGKVAVVDFWGLG